MGKPLEGIRVVSLAQQYPGPFATMLLADLGAAVTLVEHPDGGDPTRRHPAFFESLNRNKDSVSLDLKQPGDRTQLMRMLDGCDVFLEGFRPGTAARLGVAYDDLSAAFPAIVYLSISAFGQTGPYRDRPAHDLSIQAIGGLLWGRERTALAPPYIGHADLVAGMFAAFGAVVGLQQRASTGRGTFVDVSMADCLVTWMTGLIGPAINGAPPNEPAYPGYGAFECADGAWLALSVLQEDRLWQVLARALELEDLVALPAHERASRNAELTALLASRIAMRARSEWAREFDARGVAWGPVLAPAEIAADPHFSARRLFVSLPSTGASTRFVAQPLKFDGQAYGPDRPAPSLAKSPSGSCDRKS